MFTQQARLILKQAGEGFEEIWQGFLKPWKGPSEGRLGADRARAFAPARGQCLFWGRGDAARAAVGRDGRERYFW